MKTVQMAQRPDESAEHFKARVLLTERGVDFKECGTRFACAADTWSAAFVVAVLGPTSKAVVR